MRKFKIRNPWQAGLVAATAVSAVGFYAHTLNQAGNAQWAFLLVFAAAWCVMTLFWANDSFNEESGMLLAETMDQNVGFLHERLLRLEQELAQLREHSRMDTEPKPGLPRSPVALEQLV